MAVRGTASKEKLIQTIIDATGADFLGIVDKKLYIKSYILELLKMEKNYS